MLRYIQNMLIGRRRIEKHSTNFNESVGNLVRNRRNVVGNVKIRYEIPGYRSEEKSSSLRETIYFVHDKKLDFKDRCVGVVFRNTPAYRVHRGDYEIFRDRQGVEKHYVTLWSWQEPGGIFTPKYNMNLEFLVKREETKKDE